MRGHDRLMSVLLACALLAVGVGLVPASAAHLVVQAGALPVQAVFTCPPPGPNPPPEPYVVDCQ
jgi:hypothetical protein